MTLKPFIKKPIILCCCIVLLILLTLAFWPKTITQQKPLAQAVKVSAVIQKPMPVIIEMPGTVVPAKTVSIKSQVAGTVKNVNFHYGDIIKAGQVLFEIDPAPFNSALKEAQANLAQDKALLHSLTNDLSRYNVLYKKGYVSTQQQEQAQAQYNAQIAKLAADQQTVTQAKISLSYTNITAPIDGKTGNVSVKPGDLIGVNDPQPLVMINQINPIEVDFYLPQGKLPKLRFFHSQQAVNVEIWNEKLTTRLAIGQLSFIDNQIDSTTGTILLKATIENSTHKLWPGQMVAVKLILTIEPNAIVIPTKAIHTDQQGNFVFLVKHSHAIVTRIKVDRQIGTEAIISSGLKAGETIIAIASPDLTDNSLVKIE